MKKIVVSWVLCVLAAVALIAWGGRDLLPAHNAQKELATGIITPVFTLTAPDGRTVTEREFKGRYMLVFFGFTHCPDICPTTLLLMQNVLGKLGPQAAKLQPIFITVDPERDTPKVMGKYTANFGSTTLGLSGTEEQVKQAADNFKVYFSKVEMSDPAMGYMMNHSGFIYLVAPDGKYIDHYPYDIAEPELTSALKKHVQ